MRAGDSELRFSSYPLSVVISASEADSKFLKLTPNGNDKFTAKQRKYEKLCSDGVSTKSKKLIYWYRASSITEN